MRRFQLAIGCIVALWLAIASVAFSQKADCLPLFARACRGKTWEFISNVFLLTWVKDWGTLASGILALVGAGIGAYFINQQIRQSDAHEKARRGRGYAAARAVLPLGLSTLTDYSNVCMHVLQNIYDESVRAGRLIAPAVIPQPPQIPTEAIAVLKEMISNMTEIGAEPLIKLISIVQVLNARMNSLLNSLSAGGRSYILDAAETYARTSNLFDFARFETDASNIELTEESLRTVT